MATVRADVLARHERARPKPTKVIARGGSLYQGGRFVGTIERIEWDAQVAPTNVVIPRQIPPVKTGTGVYTTTPAFHDAVWSYVWLQLPWRRRMWRRAKRWVRRA